MAELKTGLFEKYFSSHADYRVEYGSKCRNYPRTRVFVIGRSKSSDFHVDVAQVSRRHCEIHCGEGGWMIHNLSMQGTWFSGKILLKESSHINDGDLLKLGEVFIQCLLRIDKSQFFNVNVIRFEIFLGKDFCSLNTVPLEAAVKPDYFSSVNDKRLELNEMDGNAQVLESLDSQRTNKALIKQLEDCNKALSEAVASKNEADKQISLLRDELLHQRELKLPCWIQELVENELQCSICNELIMSEQRLRQLLEHEEIGDLKPSQFMRHLRALSGVTVPDDFLQTLWMNRLPSYMQSILATQGSVDLATTLNCSHTFCKYCLLRWKKKNNICPICRSEITSFSNTRMIDNLIEKVLPEFPHDFQERRKDLVEAREEGRKDSTKRKRSSLGRRRSNANAHRQAITMTLRGFANIMDTTIDLSSDEDSPVVFVHHRRRQE